MFLITICLLASPYICQDQIRYYGLWMTEEECTQRMQYSDVKRRVAKYKGKVAAKCVEIPVMKLTAD